MSNLLTDVEIPEFQPYSLQAGDDQMHHRGREGLRQYVIVDLGTGPTTAVDPSDRAGR